jgi:hypothetical protein
MCPSLLCITHVQFFGTFREKLGKSKQYTGQVRVLWARGKESKQYIGQVRVLRARGKESKTVHWPGKGAVG